MQNFVKGALGFDVSSYIDVDSTPQRINFQKMHEFGCQFVIVRAGMNAWTDPDFKNNWAAARAVGLPRASYWYFDPRVSPEVQAHLFSSLFAADPPEGRLWVDLEFLDKWGGEFTHWMHWKTFIREVEELSGLRIGIYTADYWWKPHATDRGADMSFFGQYPLWVAQYINDANKVALPAGWTKAMLWQWGTPIIGRQAGVESEELAADWWNAQYRFEDEWGGMSAPGQTFPDEIGVTIGNETRIYVPKV